MRPSSPTRQRRELVLTAAGRGRLQERLDRCLDALVDLAERMSRGECSDEDLVEHQRLLKEVERLTAVLHQADDVASVAEDPRIVELGDEVVVEFEDATVETYALVHPVEASSRDGRISIASPLGRALLGRRPGDRVVIDAPAGHYP